MIKFAPMKAFTYLASLLLLIGSPKLASANYVQMQLEQIKTITCSMHFENTALIDAHFNQHLQKLTLVLIPRLNEQNKTLGKLYQQFFKDAQRKKTMETILSLELEAIDEILNAYLYIHSRETAELFLISLAQYQNRPRISIQFNSVEWPFAGFLNFTNSAGRALQRQVRSKEEYLEITRELVNIQILTLQKWVVKTGL